MNTNITKDAYLWGMRRLSAIITALCLAAFLFSSCQTKDMYDSGKPYSRVVVLFFEGYQTLDLTRNIRSLEKSPLPLKGSAKAVIYMDHTKFTPYLIHVYSDIYGNVLKDTLVSFPGGTRTFDKDCIREVFSYIAEHFPSDHYGAMFSSHGSGWLPTGYYDHPRTKSLGPGYTDSEGKVEMTIQDLAKAVSIHLDYIIFDACLMGGVETAYEMKDVCDNIIASCVEVPTDGFNYSSLIGSLLKDAPYGLDKVCQDYFDLYSESSLYGATISGINCRKLDPLVSVCSTLFDKYRAKLWQINPEKVQCYGQGGHNWFYDLEDILQQCGTDDVENKILSDALEECLFFRKASKRFMTIDINHFCGLSMYLPSAGNDFLDGYYKSLSWNTATQLVK